MENIAIYWGAFNPPTIWHQKVIEWVLEQNQEKISKIVFSPDWSRADKNYKIDEKHRRKLLEIFYDILKSKWLNVCFEKYFLEQKNWNTTTLEVNKYFTEKFGFPPYHIFWTDVIPNMKNWYWNDNWYIEKQLKKLFLKRVGYENQKELKNMDNYIVLDIETPEVSSTMVRESILKVSEEAEKLVHPEIFRYIKDNKLYKKQ